MGLCRKLFLCLSLCIVLPLFGGFTYSYSLSTKEGTVTGYDGTDEHVVIPSSFTVSEKYKDQDDGETHTRYYTISVTGIGSSAFSGNTTIKSVSFPNKLKSIGSYAFYGCTSLVSVKTPDTLTSLGGSAFYGCTSLEEAEINGTNLNLGSSQNVFYNCSSLKKVVFGDGVTALPIGSGLYNGPFVGCTQLEEVRVGSGVTEIPYAFLNANSSAQDPKPTKVSFAGKIKRVGYYSMGVSSLQDLTIELADGCVVEGYAFEGCPGVTCESIDFSKIASIGAWAFSWCYGIAGEIDISKSTYVGERAFKGCANLTDVKFAANLKSIGLRAFYMCSSLKSIDLPEALTSIGTMAFCDCTALETVEINGTNLNLGSSKDVFRGCSNLRKIKFGDGVVSLPIGSSSYNGPFVGCTALEEVIVGSGVTEIPYAFLNANSSDQDPKPTKVSFAGKIKRVGYYSMGVSSLKDLTIELADGCVVSGYAFYGCPAVSLDNIDFSKIASIGEYSFAWCSGLKGKIDISNVSSISGSAFYGCSGITGVRFSDNLKSIGASAFRDCISLVSLKIPDAVTSLGNYVFSGCVGLAAVNFGAGITSVGSQAFYNCTNASSFFFVGAPPSVGSSAFKNVKSGARGYYTAANASEWEAVIDSNGKWNGLIMGRVVQPKLEIKHVNWIEGSIDLDWSKTETDESVVWPCTLYRSTTDDFNSAIVIAEGVTDTKYTDRDFSTAEPVTEPLYYWVKPDNFKEPYPIGKAVRTRYRHAILVGLGEWAYDDRLESLSGPSDVEMVRECLNKEGGFKEIKPHINETAKIEDVGNTFNEVAKNVVKGDICLFYFSTHGGINEEGDAVLCLYDGEYNDKQLAEHLKLIDKGSGDVALIGIISACHSGAFYDNPYQSNSSTAWYLANGLAQCTVNMAWITAASAAATSIGVFDEFMFKYGWKDGWAGNSETLSFLELADYTKRQYDSLFDDVMFYGENEYTKVQIENEPLLSKIVVNKSGTHEDNIKVPSVPSDFKASQGEYKDKIKLSWEGDTEGVTYVIFHKFMHPIEGDDTCYSGFSVCYNVANSLEYNFAISKEFDKYEEYEYFMDANQEYPMVFVVKAYNGAGVASCRPFEASGWLDQSWEIEFHAEGGRFIESWQGGEQIETIDETPILRIERRDKKDIFQVPENDKGPKAEREGFVLVGWYDRSGTKLSSGDIIRQETVFYPCWSNITSDADWEVCFDAGRGIITEPWMGAAPGQSVITVKIKNGEFLIVPDKGPKAERDGFRLIGWKRAGRYYESGYLETGDIISIGARFEAFWHDSSAILRPIVPPPPNTANDISVIGRTMAANNRWTVAECYALGINPEDPDDDLKITDFRMEDGKPVITLNHTKDGSGNSFESRIRTLGKINLNDKEWKNLEESNALEYRFFKVAVDLP